MESEVDGTNWRKKIDETLELVKTGLADMLEEKTRSSFTELVDEWNKVESECLAIEEKLTVAENFIVSNRESMRRLFIEMQAAEIYMRARTRHTLGVEDHFWERNETYKHLAETNVKIEECLKTHQEMMSHLGNLKCFYLTLVTYYGMACHQSQRYMSPLLDLKPKISALEESVKCEIDLATRLHIKSTVLKLRKACLDCKFRYYHSKEMSDESV